MPSRETAIGECKVCGMPVRVIFENGNAVRVFSVCGHPKKPKDAEEVAT